MIIMASTSKYLFLSIKWDNTYKGLEQLLIHSQHLMNISYVVDTTAVPEIFLALWLLNKVQLNSLVPVVGRGHVIVLGQWAGNRRD